MYPTWPMVAAALVAGLIGGFIIPDRPRSHPAVEAPSASAEGAPKKSRGETTTGVPPAQTSEPARSGNTVSARDQAATDDRKSCAIETWPYRTPNCLDRTVAVEPAHTVVSAKRIDPSIGIEGKAMPTDDTANSKQKIVSTPAARGDAGFAKSASEASGTSAEKILEPAAEPAPARRSVRRAGGRAPNRELREAPRAYIRGPDGRIYPVPEYRPDPPRYYYIR